jgi:hypothetical protein
MDIFDGKGIVKRKGIEEKRKRACEKEESKVSKKMGQVERILEDVTDEVGGFCGLDLRRGTISEGTNIGYGNMLNRTRLYRESLLEILHRYKNRQY